MNNQPWWESIAQLLTFAILFTLFMGWMVRSRDRGRSSPGQLIQPISTLIIGIAAFAFFGGCWVLSNIQANSTVTWWTTAVFVVFAVSSIWMILLYFLDRHWVTAEGLTFTTFYGRRKFIAWSDVSSVRYSRQLKWFRLESRTGTVARLSTMLIGLPYFAQIALEHISNATIDADTALTLRATADGSPPSPWG